MEETSKAMLPRHAEQSEKQVKYHDIASNSLGLTAADSCAGASVTSEYKEHWVF